MAPQIIQFSDLSYVAEVFGNGREDFLYTEFNVIDEEDAFYYGHLKLDKLKISLEQFTAALERIPDGDIFPELPADASFTLAPDNLDKDTVYIKRTGLNVYYDYKEQDALPQLPAMMLDEAHALELISQHPHPNIIKYHGCRVRRGHITGLVLDKHANDLKDYIKNAVEPIDKESFMAALESAVHHLHSIGLAHNDINPRNIMVDAGGMPVLIDFGSCREVGRKLGGSRGTKGWVEGL